jgi:hypothetical protein
MRVGAGFSRPLEVGSWELKKVMNAEKDESGPSWHFESGQHIACLLATRTSTAAVSAGKVGGILGRVPGEVKGQTRPMHTFV